jgi:hypothetical protein
MPRIYLSHPLTAVLLTSLLLNVVLWLLPWMFFPYNDTGAVLHYNVDIGIDFIGQGRQIFLLPLIGLLVAVGNSMLGYVLYHADRRSTWVYWGIIPLVQIILIGAFFLIWQANNS